MDVMIVIMGITFNILVWGFIVIKYFEQNDWYPVRHHTDGGDYSEIFYSPSRKKYKIKSTRKNSHMHTLIVKDLNELLTQQKLEDDNFINNN